MVEKGQLLERPVVVPCGGECMDGIYLRGDGHPLLLASPLPSFGGSMASPVLNELAYAAAYAGCSSLRLDYRGVGASEGAPPQSAAQAALELSEGVAFLLESAQRARLAVAGYLSGCFAAVELARADPRVDRVLLVAPTWGEAGDVSLEGLDKPTIVVAAGDEPTFNFASEEARLAAFPFARLEVLPGTRAFRAGLTRLARLVPPFLGADEPHPEETRRRGRLFS